VHEDNGNCALHIAFLKKNPQLTLVLLNLAPEALDIANMVTDKSGKAMIYFFHADWCPHCTKAQPIWDEFCASNDKKVVNGYEVVCMDINCTDDSNKEVQKNISTFNVQSFPTVLMVKDGTTIQFDGRITGDSLNQFVTSVLA
jgi:thiol-disulfide isomerase/thioredoxin